MDLQGFVVRGQVVRFLRWALGERLAEFYDEEGEARQFSDSSGILEFV